MTAAGFSDSDAGTLSTFALSLSGADSKKLFTLGGGGGGGNGGGGNGGGNAEEAKEEEKKEEEPEVEADVGGLFDGGDDEGW